MKVIDKVLNNKLWWLWLALVFILIIYTASLTHFRIDLTKEKRFSLSRSTKNVLRNLDDEVQIDVFLTGDLSAGFKRLSVASEELLTEFKEYGRANIKYRYFRPGEGLPDSLRYHGYDSLD